jgi:hypothetical protein
MAEKRRGTRRMARGEGRGGRARLAAQILCSFLLRCLRAARAGVERGKLVKHRQRIAAKWRQRQSPAAITAKNNNGMSKTSMDDGRCFCSRQARDGAR